MTVTNKPHVLILGAGLSGLALAQSLRKQGISYEIFEKSPDGRTQGWAIALHYIVEDLRRSMPEDLPPITVVDHLQPLDLKAEFTMYFSGSRADKYRAFPDSIDMLRANRTRLRNWLATHIPIQYDKHATRTEEAADHVTVHFSDGTSATGTMLVGADGVHSFVREQLLGPTLQPQAIPAASIVGEVTLPKGEYEAQLALGTSAYFLTDVEHHARVMVGLQAVADDASEAQYYWVLSYADESAAHEPHWTHNASQQALYHRALEVIEGMDIDDRLKRIFYLTKPEGMLHPPIVIRDLVLAELPNRRITLVGDAVHPMAPYRGEGGNNAIQDSLNLGRAIGKSTPSTLLTCLKGYQDEMLDRGSKAVKASHAAGFDIAAESMIRRGLIRKVS